MTEPERRSLRDTVASGEATDDELAEFFGADLMNEVAAHFRDPVRTKAAFSQWFDAVMRPIGVHPEPAFAMFTGQTTIEDFVDGLDDATMDRFLEMYEPLQSAYQERIDRGEVVP